MADTTEADARISEARDRLELHLGLLRDRAKHARELARPSHYLESPRLQFVFGVAIGLTMAWVIRTLGSSDSAR